MSPARRFYHISTTEGRYGRCKARPSDPHNICYSSLHRNARRRGDRDVRPQRPKLNGMAAATCLRHYGGGQARAVYPYEIRLQRPKTKRQVGDTHYACDMGSVTRQTCAQKKGCITQPFKRYSLTAARSESRRTSPGERRSRPDT